jgi:branched-chain amino acid transport system substrate-binding protein
MKKVLALLITLVMMATLLASCGDNDTSSDDNSTSDSSSEAIKLGALYPLTGAMADSGKTMQNGIEYAVSLINEAGGINGQMIEVVYGDTQGDSAVSMTEMERLITQEDVDCVMGCYQSGVTSTASQISEQYSVPLLTANATSDALTSNGYEYFFRLAPTNMMFIRDMLSYVQAYSEDNDLGLTKVAVIADNSDVGQQTVSWTEYYAEEYGFEVAGTVSYTSGAADLTSEVLQLKSYDADFLVADQYVSDAILLTKTMAEQNYAPELMICKGNGYTEPSYKEAVGDKAEGITVATEFVAGTKGNEINDGFKAEYDVDLNGHSAEAFTVVQVFAEAFQNIADRDEEINPETIQQELTQITIEGEFANGTPMILPYDTIEFCEATDINGLEYLHTNLNGALTMTQFQGGQLVAVYPDDIATAEFAYPATYNN